MAKIKLKKLAVPTSGYDNKITDLSCKEWSYLTFIGTKYITKSIIKIIQP